MIKFLDHLLLSGLQIAHVDFTWPGYVSTSLIVVFSLSYYNVSRRGFTAVFNEPRVINVDKNAAYPKAFNELKVAGMIPESCELRQVKYLNYVVEQDRRFIKQMTIMVLTLLLIH